MIRLFEGPTKLLLRGDERDIQKICDQLRFYPKGFQHSAKYQAYVLTDGREGWDGTICPLKFNRDRSATCLRGHKDVILKLARKEGIEADTTRCIPSPFANLAPDDLPDDLIVADFELDQYQRESVAYWLKYGMGVNKIAVNGGKTAMFAAAAAMITRRIGNDCRFLYVTPSERLTRQAYNDMRGFLPGWKITQYGGSKKDNTGDMVICTVAMLWTNRQELIKKKWFNEFIAVLYDESHHVASETSTNLMLLLPCFFRLGASDTKHAEDAGKKSSIQGLLGPIRFTVPVGVYIDLGRSAKPHIYLIENKKWRNKYHELPHLAEPGTKAWALIGDEWREGTYAGPVYETDPKTGDYKLVKKKELVGTKDIEVMDAYGKTTTEQTADWQEVMRPVVMDGLHTLQFPNDKEFYEVSSDYCLLERVSDIAIVRFRERNEMIVKWARHFAVERNFPTLVVCTRSMHVLILEALIKRAVGAERVQTLVGEDSSKTRDKTFDWFRHTPGSVLISPLVQEGVSINEIRGGVIADYVGNWERANQIIGRFIRKKQQDNESHIAWFMDNQHLSLYRGCVRVTNRLKDIRGYTFYHPVLGPETVHRAKVYEKLD